MAKKKTAYTRERNRIMNYIRSLKRKGLSSDLYFPTEKQIRAEGVKGKELTSLARELKYWTSKKLKDYIEKENEPTEKENFEPHYSPSEDEDFFSRVVISNWYGILNQFAYGEAYNLLRSWMGSTVRSEGVSNTAEMIQRGAEAGNILTFEIVYNHDNAVLYIGNMIDFLPDEGVIYKEETLDRIEYMKRLGDALEQDEDWEYPI